ncbi:MAG TPA: hypothetical protein VFM29_04140 [Vicinamibacteria bacterium]|nr:hypothetical protein [Vicinamibacteria bacterium]
MTDMATGPIDSLLEEAIQRCAELATRAEESAAAAADVAAHAQALDTIAEVEADALHREYQEAIAAVQHASATTATATEPSLVALRGVAERARASAENVRALLASVRNGVAGLTDARRGFEDDVEGSARETQARFQDLAFRIEDMDSRFEARLAEAEKDVDDLRDMVAQTRATLERARDRLLAETEGVRQAGIRRKEELQGAVRHALAAIGVQLVQLCNDALEDHNDFVGELRTDLAAETAAGAVSGDTWVVVALAPLRDALGHLAELPEPTEAAVAGTVGRVLEDAEKATGIAIGATQTLQQAVAAVRR